MTLASFTPATAEIKHRDRTVFSVRGLSLSDLSILMRTHLPDIQLALTLWQQYQADGADGDIAPVLLGLATDAPEIVAHLIALAADSPEASAQAKQLPLPLQLEALAHLFRLTFEEYGGLEKMTATLGMLARGFGLSLPRGLPTPAGLAAKPTTQ